MQTRNCAGKRLTYNAICVIINYKQNKKYFMKEEKTNGKDDS